MKRTEAPGPDPLSRLDPTLHDRPPIPGSDRYDHILETAMTQTTTRQHPAHPGPTRRWTALRPRPAALLGAAAAAAVLTTGVLTTGDPDGTGGGAVPSATTMSGAPVVLAAAVQTGDAEDFRAVITTTDGTGATTTSTGEFDGDDARITNASPDAPDEVITVVESTEYVTSGGRTGPGTPLRAEDRPAPFSRATENVLRAALGGADSAAREVGREQVRGVSTVHYRLTPTAASRAALRALPAAELAWFELEYPDETTGVDVWLADDLVRRIEVTTAESVSRTEFYDFGADIEVVAPATS